MKDTIPFFYYDLIAKIVPGVATLALLSRLHVTPPVWGWIIKGDEGWKTAVVPLLLAGTAYLLGSLLEVAFRSIRINDLALYNRVSDRGFEEAADEFRGRPIERATPAQEAIPELSAGDNQNLKDFKYYQWQRLVLQGDVKTATAFSQAHRFQAEAKCYLHLAYPISGLLAHVLGTKLAHFWAPLAVGFATLFSCVSFVVLIWFSTNSEYRRWVQVLAFVLNERRNSAKNESAMCAKTAGVGGTGVSVAESVPEIKRHCPRGCPEEKGPA